MKRQTEVQWKETGCGWGKVFMFVWCLCEKRGEGD